MSTIDDMRTTFGMLPDDTGVLSWELARDAGDYYTMTVTVVFSLPPGREPPRPTRRPALPAAQRAVGAQQ